MDIQAFLRGDAFDAYEYFGAHLTGNGVIFRTYAPKAKRVTVYGDFTGWQEWDMSCPAYPGFWEIYVDNARPGQMYKYVIYGANGRFEHCDPYGFGMELRPGFASVIRDLQEYTFLDWDWMRSRSLNYDKPLNIYEMHIGSWKRNEDDEHGWYKYDEIADDLIAYVKKYHYTHVEFMPLAEYPFDGSWGYQTTCYFSPTSRYGTAAQLRKLIDRLHGEGIGAIIDFVPAHFAKDSYGLWQYDGGELYEYPNSDVSVSEWGTCNFIYNKGEVASFLKSAANYWLREYHFDGLRMDAISRLIYWMGDEKRGVNALAVKFLREMNAGLRVQHPTAMLIAEDSTAFPGCTKSAWDGGLGFDYKWDLGWMNDTLDYMKKQSFERIGQTAKITFSMMYYYNERHLLPFSHDEVVHGKLTILNKIFGTYEEKFAQGKTLYTYMLFHPGKKLNFMGNEIGMFREWDEEKEPDYFLLKYPTHDSFSEFMKCLNALYTDHPALYEQDYEPAGFRWITMSDKGSNVFGIQRYAKDGNESLAAIMNFSCEPRVFSYDLEAGEKAELVLDTDWNRFGGDTVEGSVDERGSEEAHKAEAAAVANAEKATKGKKVKASDKRNYIRAELPPFASMVFVVKREKAKKSKKKG